MTLDSSTLKDIFSGFTALISAATALAAVIFGLRMQSKIAKRQAADNISAKRQNWIDELRKDAAEYLTLISRLQELRRPHPTSTDEERKQTFEDKVIASARATELGIRIKLRLNPNEADHNKLVELFASLRSVCKEPPPGETPQQQQATLQLFSQERDKIISHLQIVLKREWERIKQGDIQ